MGLFSLVLKLVVVTLVCGQDAPVEVEWTLDPASAKEEAVDKSIENTELVLAYVVFRHGDRTPDQEEIDLYPSSDVRGRNIFFPYGKKALTNKGKMRGFLAGKYLRKRYDCFVSSLYLPDEISIRTTNYARTKMTALAALAALYPPMPAQKWNPALDWQPVPYDTPPREDDDLLYWYNCESYMLLRNAVYDKPEVKKHLEYYRNLFPYLSEHTSNNITTPEQVFYLDNLFQALENVGVQTPKWAQDVMPKIKEMTKIEYACEFYDADLIRFSSGVLLGEILEAANAAVAGTAKEPRFRLISAHENNVAGLMAAAKVFKPHQPHYGSTFSLELRRYKSTGKYAIAAVYSPDAGGPGQLLPVAGCGGGELCDYGTFVKITQDHAWTRAEYEHACHMKTNKVQKQK